MSAMESFLISEIARHKRRNKELEDSLRYCMKVSAELMKMKDEAMARPTVDFPDNWEMYENEYNKQYDPYDEDDEVESEQAN